MLVLADGDAIVTLLEAADLPKPSRAGDRVILEAGSPVVWFTFPGAAYDIGRFHLSTGEFTGCYANILTPVQGLGGGEWRTTDLFLDVWVPVRGEPVLLDEDEFEDALARGWIDAATAATARAEARRLLDAAAAGTWPPPVVEEWTLDRARAALRHSRSPGV